MIDPTCKLKKLAATVIKKHQFGTAISLDIHNAFNSIPWMCVMDTLENAKVPVYLCSIILDYF